MKKGKSSKPWLIVSIAVGSVLLLLIFIGIPFLSVGGHKFFGTWAYRVLRTIHPWVILLIPVLLLYLLFPLLSFVYPAISSFWERCWRYSSLRSLCLKHRFKYRRHRLISHKKGTIDPRPNVTIHKSNGIYHLHFLDIPKGEKRIVAFLNDREYRVYDTVRIKKASVRDITDELLDNEYIPKKFHRPPRLVDEERYTSYEIPEWEMVENEYHMILVSPHFVYVTKKVNEYKIVYVTNEVELGSFRLGKWKSFKNELK